MSAGLKMAEVESEAKQPLFSDLADVSISNDVPVEGQITVPVDTHSQEDDYSTLDEPVKDTIMRDLKAVGKKFVHVMYPRKSSTLLRDWDLWGPLVLCVLLAISFFQSLCVLGYCILPLTVALIICSLIRLAPHSSTSEIPMGVVIVRFIIVLAAFGWSTFASTAFLADSQPSNRKALAVYPIFLFYFVISWMIISNASA
ncbi:protein YIPF6 isoform X3 [Narcine bancroftii]|uniref:protein YIPF6 isoform X3 n=1 Tax=Narcine bancroftii TaxID=1343680 RepID=UPI0038319093